MKCDTKTCSEPALTEGRCYVCKRGWCNRCEMNSPISWYSIAKETEDPLWLLNAPDYYICDRCVKKDKWKEVFPECILRK